MGWGLAGGCCLSMGKEKGKERREGRFEHRKKMLFFGFF